MEALILVLLILGILVLICLLVGILNIDNDKIFQFSIRLALILLIIMGFIFVLTQGFLIFSQHG